MKTGKVSLRHNRSESKNKHRKWEIIKTQKMTWNSWTGHIDYTFRPKESRKLKGSTNPGSVVFQVAAFVLNCVWVSQLSQKLDFLNDVLPLLPKQIQIHKRLINHNYRFLWVVLAVALITMMHSWSIFTQLVSLLYVFSSWIYRKNVFLRHRGTRIKLTDKSSVWGRHKMSEIK